MIDEQNQAVDAAIRRAARLDFGAVLAAEGASAVVLNSLGSIVRYEADGRVVPVDSTVSE